MTVNSSLNKIQYVGAGGVTLFPFPYPFELTTDIVTTIINTATGADITGSFAFVVAGGSGDVGSVTITPAPDTITATNRITIRRTVSATQLTSYPEASNFPAKAHEKALDKLTELCQQILETQSRAIGLSPNTAVVTTPTLADPVAGNLIGWDATATNLVNYLAASTSLTPVSAFMASVLIQTTAAAARGTLVTGSSFNTEAVINAAATTDLGTLSSQEVAITGATGITSFGSSASLAAPLYLIRFTSSVTITNSAAITIAGGVNFSAVSGDMGIARYEGAGNWRLWPILGSGKPFVNPTGSLTSITDINGGQLGGFRNKIINGDCRRWDYATTYALTTTISYGSINRFGVIMNGTAAGILNQDTSAFAAGLPFRYNMKWGRNSGSALTGQMIMGQALKTENAIALAGKQVTFSFYMKAGANYSGGAIQASVVTGTSVNDTLAHMFQGAWAGSAFTVNIFPTPTTSWVRYQATGTLPAAMTQCGIEFAWAPAGTAGADDNLYITGLQLEPGGVATPFEDRGEVIEQMLCYHHLPYVISNGITAMVPGVGIGTGATNATLQIPYKYPSYGGANAISVSSAAHFTLFDGTSTVVATGITINSRVSLDCLVIDVGVAAGLTQFRPYMMYANSSSGKILVLGCEL